MLSFVVLSDGPCTGKSFRPNEDETQWWARRDALVRIVAAACFLGSHASNPVTKDLTLFFHNGQESPETASAGTDRLTTAVAVLRPSVLCQEVAVPTERNLLTLLRAAFSKAEKTPIPLLQQLANETTKSGSTAAVLCSATLWKEKLPSTSSTTNSIPDSIPAANVTTAKSLKHLQIATMDKKDLLAHLQTCCPLEFLRQHRLNGNEKLVLKKVNKAQLDTVWQAWNEEYSKMQDASTESTMTTSTSTKHMDDFQFLLQSFLVLLTFKLQQQRQQQVGSKRKLDSLDNHSNLTILLLHEDYPHELPVYGPTVDSNDNSEEPQQHEVMCVLGGVRDATDAEITALLTAAERLQIPVVGANLGRTAEFTSKIISTLCGHAISGKAIQAVRRLPPITLRAGAILQKLPSLRSNTWDGYNAKSRATEAVITHTLSTFPKQEMVVIAKLPYRKEELTTDMDSRDKVHPLVQLFVTTMWKSRMASEDANGETQGLGVDSTLILIFEGDVVVRFERKEVAEKISSSHMAAPSEYQVLSMMVELAQRSDNEISNKRLQKYDSDNVMEKVLYHALPSKLEKDDRKEFLKNTWVFSPSHIKPLTKSSGHHKQSVQHPEQSSLADAMYAGQCGCGSNVQISDKSFKYYLLLDLTKPVKGSTELQLAKVLYFWRYKEKDYDANTLQKLATNIELSPIVDLPLCPPALGVVMLQQWAYHLRLHTV